jgi:hypothetical protein
VIARENLALTEGEDWLRSSGVSIDVVRGCACAALMKELEQTHPEPGNEDVGR